MKDFAGQRILVIGLGKTGTASARFFCRRGAAVAVTDEKPLSDLTDILAPLQQEGVRFHPCEPEILSGVDLVIPSPGVPPSHRMLVEAVRRGIPVFSELELAGRSLRQPMIAITGTNGKTTTTTLIGEILAKSGKTVHVGGNIGSPLIAYADGPQPDDFVVVEVSSFQLQWTRDFHPDVAVLLNVTCDHVDYHGTFDEYRRIKERIFANQTPRDLAILNADEVETEALSQSQRINSGIVCFSSSRTLPQGIYLDGSQLVYRTPAGDVERYPVDMIKIPGIHNIENVMAAVAAARWAGCRQEDIVRAVKEFHGIAHRIEFTGEKNGVAFYDDSKATNVGAVLRALETFSRPVVLLMGGRDKEGDFETLSDMIRNKVKTLILFGEARERIAAMIGGLVETDQAATMREAMPMALRYAEAGDVVLLAPGCASFDEFKDYKERGDVFKRWIGSHS